MASKASNEERIMLGKAVIALMQQPGMTRGRLEDESWQFIRHNGLEHLIVKNWQHSLEQNVPGFCDYRELNWRLVWDEEHFKRFYMVPEPLLALYRDECIHNGVWCDNVARVSPQLYTTQVIAQITQICVNEASRIKIAEGIRLIVNPLKARS